MTDRTTLYAALRKIAWAHIFITFSFNLGTLDILPSWVGFLMIAGALPALAVERPHVATLRPMTYALAALSGLTWLGTAFGEMPYLAGLARQIILLIFFFSLHSELAELGKSYGWGKADSLLVVRNIYIITSTAGWVVQWLESPALTLILALVGFVDLLFLWSYLFDLSKHWKSE